MSASLESVLVSVWQQSLIDKKKTVDLDGKSYAVRQTSKSKLKQIDFRFEDRELRGLEQNPNTKSRWAKLARDGKQVMQFLDHGRYIAVVVDGKVHIYKQFSLSVSADEPQADCSRLPYMRQSFGHASMALCQFGPLAGSSFRIPYLLLLRRFVKGRLLDDRTDLALPPLVVLICVSTFVGPPHVAHVFESRPRTIALATDFLTP